jgi:hypothetical protein
MWADGPNVRPDVAIAHATYEISGMIGPDAVTMPPHQEIGLRLTGSRLAGSTRLIRRLP